jgi:hypothetical protein
MAYEQKDNTGTIFKNNKKTDPKHPDYTGSAMIDGVKKDLSAWIKDGQKGKFLSIAIRDPYTPQSGTNGTSKPASKVTTVDEPESEDLPF